MLVFIDESGDPGLKINQGSSRYFTIALVIFDDRKEAAACDRRIELLKKQLGWTSQSEFHFKRNSDNVRRLFLEAISPYNFFYHGVVINKDPKKLFGNHFKDKSSFYKYTCGLVFQNAKEVLEDSIVVVDQSGNQEFRNQLATYLRHKINEQQKQVIKKVKMQRSEGNNLIQLADYVAGVINRSIDQKRKDHQYYRRIISHRELRVQIWPK